MPAATKRCPCLHLIVLLSASIRFRLEKWPTRVSPGIAAPSPKKEGTPSGGLPFIVIATITRIFSFLACRRRRCRVKAQLNLPVHCYSQTHWGKRESRRFGLRPHEPRRAAERRVLSSTICAAAVAAAPAAAAAAAAMILLQGYNNYNRYYYYYKCWPHQHSILPLESGLIASRGAHFNKLPTHPVLSDLLR